MSRRVIAFTVVVHWLALAPACGQPEAPLVRPSEPMGSAPDFVLDVPPGVRVFVSAPASPADGPPTPRYVMYRAAGFDLQTRYGPAPAPLPLEELSVAPKADADTVVEESVALDGRPAKLRRWYRGQPRSRVELDVDAPAERREHDFNAIAFCYTVEACGEAEDMVRSIRFRR
jgi:hypothetical protein